MEQEQSIRNELLMLDLTPEAVRAIQALSTGSIPPEFISEHPGKGDKDFKYVKHTHATKVMNDSGLLWDYEADVAGAQLFPDRSVAIACRLTVTIPVVGSEPVKRTVQEVGAFSDDGAGMPSAMLVASAASRGLPRCMFRMFGFGAELYPDSSSPPIRYWQAVVRYGKGKGLAVDVIRKCLKSNGFSSEEDVKADFSGAMKLVRELAGVKPVEKFEEDNGTQEDS